MSSEEPSCSECKLELIEKKWTQLMLKWINRCVSPYNKIDHLALRNLVEVMDRYKGDVCADELDYALLAGDEVESFIKYKYPMLRLRYLAEAKDYPKKLYIMASILLYHCCANSQEGVIDRDICAKLYKVEQELIIRFCENLSEMETTINNVDLAIQKAFENVGKGDLPCESSLLSSIEDIKESNKGEPAEPIDEEEPETYTDTVEAVKSPNTKFMSSISVMPSIVVQSAYSMSDNSLHPSCFCEDDEQGKVAGVKPVPANNADDCPCEMPPSLPVHNMKQSNSDTKKKISKQDGLPNNNLKRGSFKNSTTLSLKEKLIEQWWNTRRLTWLCCICCGLMTLLLIITSAIYYSKLHTSTKHLKESLGHHHGNKDSEKIEDSQHTIAPGSPGVSYGGSHGDSLAGSLGGSLGRTVGGSLEGYLGGLEGSSEGSLESSTVGSHGVLPEGSTGGSPGGSPGGPYWGSHEGSPWGSHGGFDGGSHEGSHGGSHSSHGGSYEGSHGGSPGGSHGGSQGGSHEASHGGSHEGSHGGSHEGSHGGSHGGSHEGSHGGSHEGSHGGSHEGSHGGSHEGSHGGSHEGSHGGSYEGSPGGSLGGSHGGSHGGSPGDSYWISHEGSSGGSHGGTLGDSHGGSTAGVDLFGVYFPEVPRPPGGGLNGWPPADGHSADSLPPAQHTINLNPDKTKLYRMLSQDVWHCEKGFCQKMYKPTTSNVYYTSLSRCSLLCMGPQLWPHPIGYTHYSSTLVALATQKLEYKFVSVPSDNVHQYLAEAFKLFIGDLARLERIDQKRHNQTDMTVRKMNIAIDVENDADPRMRYDTDESYTVRVETLVSQVHIHISSPSFCGIRHGLETLSQLILLDQSTGNLITLSNILVKDAPSYKYRGLMIDTARNYIPVADIMRTVDAMGTVKLNTFHWRISDATSFPWYLPEVPNLFEYGAYDRTMVYTKQDILAIVHRAGIRGVRVLIEVAAPGPVGRAWSWCPHIHCPEEDNSLTSDELLCSKLELNESVLDVLQTIYAQILELTQVDDMFHLSDGLFSLSNCRYLHKNFSDGFLEMALDRLRTANKGSLPRLPIIWYTSHLKIDLDAQVWDTFGVQMSEWVQGAGDPSFLSRFRVVHSSRWSLSCQMIKQRCTKYRTWQEMYGWKSWKNLEVLSLEGGEAVLWTDLVDSGNLDYHLWPRLSAVAERLWSDVAANESVNGYTYARLDALGWRMMIRGVTVQPVWPVYCSFNPLSCINKLKYKYMLFSFKYIKNGLCPAVNK